VKTLFIYLHGFASSPQSQKATAFKKEFDRLGIPLTVPDLEDGDFKHLTLTRQMETVNVLIRKNPGNRIALIGSSMGGYLAALTGQVRQEVVALYLMCPGFNFLERWGRKVVENYRVKDETPPLITVYNYRYNKHMELDTGIFKDAVQWDRISLDRTLPTRVVHGIHDDTVPIEESRNFARKRPWVRLEELDSDHGLISHMDWIKNDCVSFFREEGLIASAGEEIGY